MSGVSAVRASHEAKTVIDTCKVVWAVWAATKFLVAACAVSIRSSGLFGLKILPVPRASNDLGAGGKGRRQNNVFLMRTVLRLSNQVFPNKAALSSASAGSSPIQMDIAARKNSGSLKGSPSSLLSR